jgi:hypothetical protein
MGLRHVLRLLFATCAAALFLACNDDVESNSIQNSAAGSQAQEGNVKNDNPAGGPGTASGGSRAQGGNDENDKPAGGTSPAAGAGNSLVGGAAGGGPVHRDLIAAYLEGSTAVCDQVVRCYPELNPSKLGPCTAPASNGGIVLNVRLSDIELQTWETCLRSYSDQAQLATWLECIVAKMDGNLDCYQSCPATADECGKAAYAQGMLCSNLYPGSELRDCVNH